MGRGERIRVLTERIQPLGGQKDMLGERIHSIRQWVNPLS
jgi:hypothetical protein